MERVSELYRRKFARKVHQYNKPMQLPSYFAPLIGDKKRVVIAEVGAGPINTIGDVWPGVEVEMHTSDVLAHEYNKLWIAHRVAPLLPVITQDFENFNYSDGIFDIVHCVNALDHTRNPKAAIAEMKRICKEGGYVYLRHSPMQMNRFGGHHYWNIYMQDKGGLCVFESKNDRFTLTDFETRVENDLIVSLWKKI